MAKKMIRAAAGANADAVKFQTYSTEKLIAKDVPVFPRAKALGYRTQFERFKRLEFSGKQFEELSHVAKESGIIFMSTPFDNDSVDMLDPLVNVYKIASGDLINIKLIRHVVSKNKPV